MKCCLPTILLVWVRVFRVDGTSIHILTLHPVAAPVTPNVPVNPSTLLAPKPGPLNLLTLLGGPFSVAVTARVSAVTLRSFTVRPFSSIEAPRLPRLPRASTV